MNVWLLTIGETLGDENGTRKWRTGRVAEKLAAIGHHVLWWTSAFEHQRLQMVAEGDVRRRSTPTLDVQFLSGGGYRTNVSVRRYVDHRIIAGKFRRLARKEPPPDVIVAALPCHHLAFEAVRYAKHAGVPVVVDVRDLWPDIFVTAAPRAARLPLRLLLAQDFRRCAAALSGADSIIAVSEDYLQWGLRKAQRTRQTGQDRVFYLGVDPPPNTQVVPEWLRPLLTSKVFAFVGTFGRSYELDLVLDAAEWAIRTGRRDVRFVIAGTGEQFQRIAQRAKALNNVVLPGWIGPDEIDSLLARAYAGLAPYSFVTDRVPNKPFEYLAAGLPIVSSLEGEMARLISTHNIGFNYQPGDLEGLCAALTRTLDRPDEHDQQSIQARQFFERSGNAERIYADYASHVVAIGRKPAPI